MEPRLPSAGDKISVSWLRQLVDWIKNDIAPRGDGLTTTVNGNVVHANAQTASNETYFKLEHRVELIESGGVQIKMHYAELKNPGRVYAFGSSAPILTSSIPVPEGGTVYLQYSASGGVEITQNGKNDVLYPGIVLGSIELPDGKIRNPYTTRESDLHLNDCTPFYRSQPLCKPVISGGVEVTLVLPMVTDIRRTDYFDYPDDLVTLPSAYLLQSGGDLYASAAYDSATGVFSAGYVQVPADHAAPSGMTIYLGRIGSDLGYRYNRVTFGGEYYIK